jgi:toxin ParE1/3/4
LKSFVLSAEADEDIQEIYLYSSEHWGDTQATQYVDNLFNMFEALAVRPSMARARPETRNGIRGFRVGSHLVLFVETKTGIGIVRVLHESMDIEHATLATPFPDQV